MVDEGKRCQVCGRLYVTGSRRTCRACQREKGRPRAWRWKERPPLRCDCGKPAVIVVEVEVGLDGAYHMRMALCEECYRLEKGEQA